MPPRKSRSNPPPGEGLCFFIKARFIVASLLFHSLTLGLLSMSWHPITWRTLKEDRMVVRLLPQATKKIVLDPTSVQHTINEPFSHAKAQNIKVPDVDSASNKVTGSDTTDHDEGYLPQRFLSNAATPEDEIDLQDIQPPEATGTFRMLVWINSRGKVTRVDVDETETPSWFVDQVINKFRESQFKPGLRDGIPVASIIHVEVNF